jgi:hypothetical protein
MYRTAEAAGDRLKVDLWASSPFDHLPGKQIDHDHKAQPPLPPSDICDVCFPSRIWARGRDMSLDQVRGQHSWLANLPAKRTKTQ